MAVKGTGRGAASKAGRVLTSDAAGKYAKKAAASALSQRKSPRRKTSTKVAKAASRVMRNSQASTGARSAAAVLCHKHDANEVVARKRQVELRMIGGIDEHTA